MRKFFIISIVLLWIVHSSCFAQKKASLDEQVKFINNMMKIDTLMQEKKIKKMPVIYEKVLDGAEKVYGSDSKQYAALLTSYSLVLINLEKIDIAINNLNRSIEIYKEQNIGLDRIYTTSLFFLATSYTSVGENSKAEKLYDEGVKAIKRLPENQRMDYYSNLNRAGSFYYKFGLYDKAEPLLFEMINHSDKSFGKDIDYVVGKNNLINIYFNTGRDEQGREVVKEIFPIIKKLESKTKDFSKKIQFTEILAKLYYYLKDYKKSEKYFKILLSSYQDSVNFNDGSSLVVMSNLGRVYSKIGEKDKAIESNLTSLRKIVNRKEKNTEGYIEVLQNLFELYWEVGDFKKAFQTVEEEIIYIKKAIDEKNTFMSESERENYINLKYSIFETFNSFIVSNIHEFPKASSKVYNNTLFLKQNQLTSSVIFRKEILQSSSKVLKENFYKWVAVKRKITALLDYNQVDSLVKLENQANNLEKSLVSNSSIFKEFTNKKYVQWEDIRANLKTNEVAIEFIDFQLYSKGWANQHLYYALVITNKSQYPKMIRLFDEEKLKKYLSKNTDNTPLGIASIYGKKHQQTELYNLVWRPLEKYVKNFNVIYMSPSGLLNTISFSSLYNGNEYLVQKHNLIMLGSTSKVIETKQSILKNINRVSLFGGIQYGSRALQYLEGTKEEVNKIAQLFKKNNITTELFVDYEATEEAFKEKTGNSQILHVATHGFFKKSLNLKGKPVKKKKILFDQNLSLSRGGVAYEENPLMRSGLFFAESYTNTNGILTAMEVTQLDLRKTELIVLSACETSLGDIKRNEGVYGLQRAFKMAGVGSIITSLWKVDDQKTAEFMKAFYDNLMVVGGVREAFIMTQRESSQRLDPYFWGAFVLTE